MEVVLNIYKKYLYLTFRDTSLLDQSDMIGASLVTSKFDLLAITTSRIYSKIPSSYHAPASEASYLNEVGGTLSSKPFAETIFIYATTLLRLQPPLKPSVNEIP